MIRRLERRDAEFMLEWMHDRDIKQAFRYPFEQSTLESVTAFIENSFTETDRHFAVVDDADEYLGTISLKNISYEDCSAEYAIIIRRRARGTGVAARATRELLAYAFDTLGLHRVYLNVLAKNEGARHFYIKCGFVYEGTTKDAIVLDGKYESLAWYGIINHKDNISSDDGAHKV